MRSFQRTFLDVVSGVYPGAKVTHGWIPSCLAILPEAGMLVVSRELGRGRVLKMSANGNLVNSRVPSRQLESQADPYHPPF